MAEGRMGSEIKIARAALVAAETYDFYLFCNRNVCKHIENAKHAFSQKRFEVIVHHLRLALEMGGRGRWDDDNGGGGRGERRSRARRWVPGGVEDGVGRLRRGGHCMRYEAQTGFRIWIWKGQKRAAEPSPKGGFHCCLQPHFSGRKGARVGTLPEGWLQTRLPFATS